VAVPYRYRRGVIWVEPRLVVEVEFTTWTADGILRHPSFEGVREEKVAKSVMERTEAANER
jgi:bifunctional non-homologous end joining protein LigD